MTHPSTLGRHVVADLWGCPPAGLTDVVAIERLLREAAAACGATVLDAVFQRFATEGVSGVVIVAESHLSIHTWPERGYAAVDFYTCGDAVPDRAVPILERALGAASVSVVRIERGLAPGPGSLRVAD